MASLYGLLLAVGTIRGKDDIHTGETLMLDWANFSSMLQNRRQKHAPSRKEHIKDHDTSNQGRTRMLHI